MGFLLAFLSALCFSITNIVLKKGMTHSTTNGLWVITLMNVLVLGAALLAASFIKEPPQLTVNGILLFATAGFLINVIGRPLLYKSIRINGSSKAVAIKNSAPVFTLIFALFFLHERIAPGPMIGIICILTGLFVLAVFTFKEDRTKVQRSGYLYALLAAVGYGFGQGLTKEAMNVLYEPVLGAFIGTVIALFVLTVYETFRTDNSFFVFMKASFRYPHYIWAGILTGFALLFFYLSASLIYVSYSVAILAVDPVITVILAYFFLKKEETIPPVLLIVGILVFIGAGLISLLG
ncbi:DMT family transporter [Bacillus sp. H-16]|uniref:DMT family transporter n=1 Tax=Alteribacter salitolerans TaxID=2912333 RepID=UPI001964DBB8|nr:DMT family transporter [Alteribacter salitolerans]MBM7094395.1 DMT family transporter [Alteribacter salitolerans]